MRSGLEGVVSTVPLPAGEPGVTGESTDAQGQVWHWRFHALKPIHRIQGAWMQNTPEDVLGIHGTWLNAPTPKWWDDPNAPQALNRFDEMQGPLQGLRFEKRTLKLQLHVDFARQHPLFVFEHEQGLAFAHSLWRLVALMRTMGWPVESDAKASALLVAHGAILGTRTLALGVSKLMPGHTFEWTPQGASQRPRVDLTSNRHVVQDLSEAIELVDHAFMASVQSMVATNEAHGCAQVNLLSGGLDSRLVLLATQHHASEVQSLCFARTGSLDQIIAAEVAHAQGTRHHFHSLGSGEYMTSLATVEDYDGAVNHLASAHHRSALEAAHDLDMGVLASGQTANVLFTEKDPQRMQDAFPLGRVPRALQSVAREATEEALSSSPDAHVAKLWNRSFLSTNSGAYSTRPWGVLWSPFASSDVVRAALAIHPSLLADHRFYLTWLAKKHPEAQDHMWERYRVRPALGSTFNRAVWKAMWQARIQKRLPWRSAQSMSPVGHWRAHTPEVKAWFDQPDPSLLSQWKHHPELEEALGGTWRGLGVTAESSVLTLLEASRLLFHP